MKSSSLRWLQPACFNFELFLLKEDSTNTESKFLLALRQRQQKGILDILVGVFGVPLIIKLGRTIHGQLEARLGEITRFHGYLLRESAALPVAAIRYIIKINKDGEFT